jgi:perosamine synthetase
MTKMTKITMAQTNLSENAWKYVNDTLASGWLSRKTYIPRFEEEVAERHGAKYGIAVSSGTDALKISLAILKETGGWPDRTKVIVPALTFVATVNAVLQNNLAPIFCDVDKETGNIDFKTKTDEKAIVPVHLFGLPAEMPKDKNLKVVEDSCETFGVHKLKGDMACFSFYVSHHVSTGVGGMILTNSGEYEKLARSYMNHGRIDDGTHFEFGRVGYSSRMTELQAALGCAALERFDEDLEKRRGLAKKYLDYFPEVKWRDNHSWMFFPLLLEGDRTELMAHLLEKGIESREAMPLINQPIFKKLYEKGSCPNAEIWTENGILLPLHPKMTEDDVAYVCEEFLSKRLSRV